MGVKKKREVQVAAVTVCHQDLETLRSFADVEGTNLASLLLHCVQLTDGVSQIQSVKQIVPLLEKVDKNGVCDPATQSCLDILAGIYFSLALKNPLKKVLASSLNGLPEFFLTEATHSFTSHLQEELNTADLHSYRKVIDNISSCMENFNLGRSSVVNLLENDDLLQTIQSTSGLAVILFVKTMFHPPEKLPGLVRIDTLGLLCESNRSTEVVSIEEMQWVRFFITYNLNSQSPGVRQQICSLLKKNSPSLVASSILLPGHILPVHWPKQLYSSTNKRNIYSQHTERHPPSGGSLIQESSQVLYKLEQRKSAPDSESGSSSERPPVSLQQYKNFMSSVCNILFEALFPGSSYSTRFSALSILGSVAEVFAVSEGNIQPVYQLSHDIDAGRFQILMECFTSTFEEVKTLAFDLLMKLSSVTARQFQDAEKLQGLFQAALELSTSTKPYDCVTASYLLNLLIWQDALPASLTASQAQQLTHRAHGAAEKATVLERNTLVVIKCLMENLEDEISQAEDSLLQAASSFPMYGRVHCITRAFQKLPLNDLRLVSEWRPVVEGLLLLSYRLSAVVSPVIQSSSPEGLIPMDTDSESASRLQVILNEIQPRDTNAYFNQAKILKECDSFDLEDLSASVSNIDSSAEIKGKETKTCDVTAQMVLVCCWRSMKEVALLLGTLCQLLPMRPVPESSNGLLTVQQVKEIGDYFKQHLLQSRHRGAFELAYTGFVKLTEILNRCSAVSLQKLPEQWLWNVLEEIKSSDPSSKLCATRRSAGIPFYIQVHALNILRALFRDTRLGENIIPYVADGAKAAILGFTSPVWAVSVLAICLH
ncbi:putative thyroid adenoma-associated protein isoform 2 [Cricetulus griseus]|nr:putative thyroid adenoma-associated protein isoform 2 [Cricetulus griseus]